MTGGKAGEDSGRPGMNDQGAPNDDGGQPYADEGVPDFTVIDDEGSAPALTFWQSVSEISRGLVALVLVSVGVLALYVLGGIFLGVLTWAAPAVLAITAAIVLARYISRTK